MIIQYLALQYQDGYIYRGQGYPPQNRSGFGILTNKDGQEVYAGNWKDNYYEGDGKLKNLEVEELQGPFDYTNMTILGNKWASYEGAFKDGVMHMEGTLILSNQEKYTGQFNNGMIHGKGQFLTLENKVIQATWDQGILKQKTEEVKNELKGNKILLMNRFSFIISRWGQGYPPQNRSGFGILTNKDGQEVYVGNWKDNQYEGDGKLKNLEVEELQGPFDYTNMTILGNKWASYEGAFKDSVMHMEGTLILSNQEKYTGQFNNGMIHGKGQFLTLENKVIQATWDYGILQQYIG